ncbi:hypothetical protein [Rhodococcoides yunnanense]|uniref:hypothetical protein n=1 Tax=Rhodococcoides yunnanense TaxID=278209 RepID=UPI00093430A7|nr:hypothetical protein [Rhodococcus yunnanensis]
MARGTEKSAEVFRGPQVEYGELLRVDDHTTVLPVSRRTRWGGAVPVGIFTVTEGSTTWTPAIDGGRVALIGVLTGLIAATLGSAAVLRQPPWPKMTIDSK